MTYTELYDNLQKYSTKPKFTVMNLNLEYFYHATLEDDVYDFIHKDVSYLITNKFDGNLKDKILIQLNNELKKLIRKEKINRILKQEINI